MAERVVSGIGCNGVTCPDHGYAATRDPACNLKGGFARITGRKIRRARTQVDHGGNVESLELVLDDGQVFCIDPEVHGDRLVLSIVAGS